MPMNPRLMRPKSKAAVATALLLVTADGDSLVTADGESLACAAVPTPPQPVITNAIADSTNTGVVWSLPFQPPDGLQFTYAFFFDGVQASPFQTNQNTALFLASNYAGRQATMRVRYGTINGPLSSPVTVTAI